MTRRNHIEIVPRLLNEEQAKTFLGGAQPGHVLPPLPIGSRKLWDRVALEKRLDEMSGLAAADSSRPLSALEAWEAEHGDDAA